LLAGDAQALVPHALGGVSEDVGAGSKGLIANEHADAMPREGIRCFGDAGVARGLRARGERWPYVRLKAGLRSAGYKRYPESSTEGDHHGESP
jgi:hypothetical protein